LYQLCALLGKYELPFSNEVLAKQLAELIDDDENLPQSFDSEEQGRVLFYASEALRELLGTLDLREIHPKPGRGAVFPKAEQWEKYSVPFDEALEEQYDSGSYFCSSALMRCEGQLVDWERSLLSGSYDPRRGIHRDRDGRDFPHNTLAAKVAAVPKTNSEARLINVENALRGRIQQGQREAIYDHVEEHPLTRGHVNFRDQTINARLALESSETKENGTLDMKKASDLNGLALVRALWPSNVCRKLESSRTKYCYIPSLVLTSGKVVPDRWFKMKKFAPMGSAVCFPVEALTFWALGIAALLIKHENWTLRRASRTIYVYGDDVIVRSEDVEAVANTYELFGLRVNRAKTFVRGQFRESCGMDAFHGQKISPIRVKSRLPECVGDAEALLSWITYSDSLHEAGYTRAAWLMKDHVESILGHLPYSPDRRFIGWRTEVFSYEYRRRVRRERDHSQKQVRDVSSHWLAPVENGRCLTPRSFIVWGQRPLYQGLEEKHWVPHVERIDMSDSLAFPQEMAYLRWCEPKRELEPWMNLIQETLTTAERCNTSSAVFTPQHNISLRKVWKSVT
jgi:hypothetical protein